MQEHSESRAQGGTEAIKQLVHKAIGTVENYFNRQGVLGGIATGFADLDRMTDGLHGGEMIVIAARPSNASPRRSRQGALVP